MKADQVDNRSKMKVISMLEKSSRQSHGDAEVVAVLDFALIGWIDTKSTEFHSLCCERVFMSWGSAFPIILAELVEQKVLALLTEGNVSTLRMIKLLSFSLEALKNHTQVIDNITSFICNHGVLPLAKGSCSITELSALSTLLLHHPLCIPSGKSDLLNVILYKLSGVAPPADEVKQFIHGVSSVARLIRYIWNSSQQPSSSIFVTLYELFKIISHDSDQVAIALASVLQSVPKVINWLIKSYDDTLFHPSSLIWSSESRSVYTQRFVRKTLRRLLMKRLWVKIV